MSVVKRTYARRVLKTDPWHGGCQQPYIVAVPFQKFHSVAYPQARQCLVVVVQTYARIHVGYCCFGEDCTNGMLTHGPKRHVENTSLNLDALNGGCVCGERQRAQKSLCHFRAHRRENKYVDFHITYLQVKLYTLLFCFKRWMVPQEAGFSIRTLRTASAQVTQPM